MKTDRLFGIVYMLLNGKTTASKLARRFGVSKRTVMRDIETLSVAGVPIYTTQGNGGGVALLDGFVLDKTVLSESEREQILFGLKTLAPTGQTAALDKLDRIFSSGKIRDIVDVDFSRWGMPFDGKKYETVKNAVVKCRAVSFSYPNENGEYFVRTVYPLKLLFKGKGWYIQAFCLLRNDYRTFKINRMENIAELDETFDADKFCPPSTDMGRTQCEVTEISAVFTPQAAIRVYDEFYPHEITKNVNGTLAVKTSMPLNDWVYGYLLSFGDLIVRLEPQSLCDVINKKVENMRATYLKTT